MRKMHVSLGIYAAQHKCWWSFSSCMNYGSWEQVHLVISISMKVVVVHSFGYVFCVHQ
jgi:hypothetical protein